MDLYKLGTTGFLANPWQPGDVVEDWTSLIWTERYTEAGEFQLKTPAVHETLTLIPDGSHVCINESREIMRVKSHSIAVNEDGVEEATITGKSLETFLTDRNVNADVGIPYPMLREYKVQEALGVLIHNSIANGGVWDETGGPYANDPNRSLGHRVSIFDNIVPQKALSTEDPPDITDLQSVQEWYLENGDAYKFVLDWLRLGELGIRTTRPVNAYTDVILVGSTAPDIGAALATPFTHPNVVVWDIYNGRNRSVVPSEVDPHEPVIFRHDAGHILTPNYLLSREGFKNYCRVVSSEGEVTVWDGDDGYKFRTKDGPEITPIPGFAPPVPTGVTIGVDRYEMILDLGTIDPGTVTPEKYMRLKGKAELKKRRRQILLDGAISANAPYVFGTDYYLGDYVTVMGQYDVSETMQVAEYIRSQDKDGYKAYPTLIRQDLQA